MPGCTKAGFSVLFSIEKVNAADELDFCPIF